MVKSLVPLTDNCQVAIGGTGVADYCLIVEVVQRMSEGNKVTTLLLNPDKARELAGTLMQYVDRMETKLHHRNHPG